MTVGTLVLALAAGAVSAEALPTEPKPSKSSAPTASADAPSFSSKAKPAPQKTDTVDTAEPTTGNAVYAYDAANRLVGVTDPDGETARYRYDAAGNRLGIDRFTSSTLSVLSVVPVRAPVGAKLTLSGTGFSSRAEGNTVTIGGKKVVVASASATRLVVTVPADATSGRVTVSTGGSTAEGLEPFTLASAPAVSKVEPASGPPGTEVTITGAHFAKAASDNVVRFNGGTLAETIQATDGTLTVKVPAAATSGRITVQTQDGKATSASDFLIPLSEDEETFETTIRTAINDAPSSVAVTQAGKRARLFFDADQGQDLSVGFTQATFTPSGTAELIDPRGDVVGTSSNILPGSDDWEVRDLPVSGTYTLVVNPSSTTTGSVTVTLSEPVGGELSFAGNPAATVMSRAGQDGLWTFTASVGESFSLGIDTASMTDSLTARLYAPGGEQVDSLSVSKAFDGSLDLDKLPASGIYTLYLDPANGATGTATVTISHFASAASLDPQADPKQLAISRPGQDGTAVFTGTAGQKVSLGITSAGFTTFVTYYVYAPDGSKVDSFTVSAAGTTDWDSAALPQSGTYQLRMSPARLGTGALTTTLSTLVDAGRLSSTGSSEFVDISRLGQNAEATFNASSGDDLSLAVTENTFTTVASLTVTAPSGAKVAPSVSVTSGKAHTQGLSDLPEAGTYTVTVDPFSGAQGSMKLTLSTDITVNAAVDGTSVSATAARPGQRIRARFSAGSDLVSVGLTSNTINQSTDLTLIGPAGGNGDAVGAVGKSTTQAAHLGPLYAGSAYTLLLEPQLAGTGSVTLWLSAPAKAGALSATGRTGTINRPGQQLEYTLAAQAGDGTSALFTGTTLTGTTAVKILSPASAVPNSLGNLTTSPTDVDVRAPLAAGTHRILVQPSKPVTGSTTATAVADVDGGVLTVDGSSRSASIGTAGQNARFTFTGTTGQKLTLNLGTAPPSAWYLSIYGPNDKWLVNERPMTTATLAYALAALPTSGTYTLTVAPATMKTGTYSLGLSTTAAASTADSGRKKETKSSAKKASDHAGVDREASAGGTVPTGADAWQPDKHNLKGLDWLTRRGATPKTPVRLRAPPGKTAVSGHVLRLDGKPLAGVSVRVGTKRTLTDAKGRFLLVGISPQATTLIIDGSTANTKKRAYGRFEIRIHPKAGMSVDLGFPVWMAPLDTKHTVTFEATAKKDVVLTTPSIPGLEVRIPAGSVVRDEDGKPVTELGITAIPIDRPPFPLPEDGIVPVYFTVQPGGTYVFPKGAQIIYPNYTREPPGTRVDFMDYDPDGKGWYVYGHGEVSADGTQVIPDAKTRVWAFHGAMFNVPSLPNWLTGWMDDTLSWLSGDPVELSTGLLTDTHTDLAINDSLTPIEISRTYWQGDTSKRAFGIGRDLIYNAFLHSEEQYKEVDLYLPGGRKVHYVRTSSGTSFRDAVFQPTSASGSFRSTMIKWNAGWELSFPDGTVWEFPQYSPLNEIRDRYGNTLTLTRANRIRGPITRLVTSNGRWINLTYDAQNRVTQARDNTGRTTAYTYDSVGRLETVTDPAGKVSSFTYDGTSNRIATAKDARGIVYMTNTYDTVGRVKKQTLTEGQEYTFAYTQTGTGQITATEVTQPGGSVRKVEFDTSGFGISDTQAYGTALARTTVYERGTKHRINAVIDPYGRRTELSYDNANHITGATELAGTAQARSASTVVFDGPYDQPSSITDPLGHTTQLTYEPNGDLTKVTDPEGRKTTFTYTSTGQVKTVTDNANATTTYTYDNGDLTQVKDAEGRVTQQFTDAAGRVSAVTDEAGSLSAITYDKLNQSREIADPLGHTTALGYDANGNLTTLTDARGNTTTWAYDNADRPKTATDPLGAQASFEYDTAGLLKTATSLSGKAATAEYDLLGRPKTTKYGVNPLGQAESTVTYGYDAKDLLKQITDSQNGTQSFTYDAYDRPATSTGPTGTVSYDYDNADRRTLMTASGTSTTYGYDKSSILTSVKTGTQEVTLGLDAAGREKSAALPGGITRTTGYDTTGVIESLTYAQGTKAIGDLTYTRDVRALQTGLTGSLAKIALPAAESGTEFGKDNRITTYAGRTFTYDTDGQLKNDGIRTYTWNARGELTNLIKAGTASSFAYDPLGGRMSKTTGGTTNRYLTDGNNPLVEQDSAGATKATVATSGLDEFLTRTEAGKTQIYLTDALGTVVGLANTDGTIATSYAYDPNGTPTASGATSSNPYTFTGREDDGTGLLYYRNRYYDPQTGRFISQDPIGHAGGTNLYQYALSSPTTYTDPTGNNPMIAGCVIGGLFDGGMDWLAQRLSGRKVNWGQVGQSAVIGCLSGTLGAGIGAKIGSRVNCTSPNSFTGDTPALMADGTHKPIKDIKIGDIVLATDPETGETGPRKVTTLINGEGYKQLVDITLKTDESKDSSTEKITATNGHPFWVPTLHRWIEADDLKAGQWLQTSAGTWVQITSVRHRTQSGSVYNLTVDDLHTYHAVAGATPVLVHNCGSKAGEAIVHLDRTAGHASITVRHGDDILHTEQAGVPGTRAVPQNFVGELSDFRVDVRIPLPNASRARSYQDVTLGRDLGAYDEATRSCITYCAEVLRAGGVQGIPIEEGSLAITRWLIKMHG
ncbi:RHS repeat-associated core domain-containing protein [Streptomyces cyaneogriseus]|uniref:RHS repeat-associated core domain-containing protein n=1 Tax=Streptomyces cyaneogriseus TaxID=68192 RepID=UPI00133133EE|nr:RHS repeat-associated core domain-containing protein [Streptomyces cyaneogriseus]